MTGPLPGETTGESATPQQKETPEQKTARLKAFIPELSHFAAYPGAPEINIEEVAYLQVTPRTDHRSGVVHVEGIATRWMYTPRPLGVMRVDDPNAPLLVTLGARVTEGRPRYLVTDRRVARMDTDTPQQILPGEYRSGAAIIQLSPRRLAVLMAPQGQQLNLPDLTAEQEIALAARLEELSVVSDRLFNDPGTKSSKTIEAHHTYSEVRDRAASHIGRLAPSTVRMTDFAILRDTGGRYGTACIEAHRPALRRQVNSQLRELGVDLDTLRKKMELAGELYRLVLPEPPTPISSVLPTEIVPTYVVGLLPKSGAIFVTGNLAPVRQGITPAEAREIYLAAQESDEILASRDRLSGALEAKSRIGTIIQGQRAIEAGGHAALIWTDAISFKENINDKFGQDVGDIAIARLADAMYQTSAKLRERGIQLALVRAGGDEYLVVAGSANAFDAREIAEGLAENVAAQRVIVDADGEAAELDLRIRFEVATARQGDDLLKLFVDAEKRMRDKKQAGKVTLRGQAKTETMRVVSGLEQLAATVNPEDDPALAAGLAQAIAQLSALAGEEPATGPRQTQVGRPRVRRAPKPKT